MTNNKIRSKVLQYGSDILESQGMEIGKSCIQHGETSVLEHSFNVACLSLYIARKFNISVNEKEIVRGALLHDYFMYDWHTKDTMHKYHGFTHAKRALHNAKRDFPINSIEENIIIRHMFPLNIIPPKHSESLLVCLADKVSAVVETFYVNSFIFKMENEEKAG